MLSKEEFGRRWARRAVVLGDGETTLLSPCGYHKQTEHGVVYVVGDLEEATDGGYGRQVLTRVTPRGTPDETVEWAREAIAAAGVTSA